MLCWVPGTTTDEEKEGMEDFVGGARTGLEKNDAPVSALLWAELSHLEKNAENVYFFFFCHSTWLMGS